MLNEAVMTSYSHDLALCGGLLSSLLAFFFQKSIDRRVRKMLLNLPEKFKYAQGLILVILVNNHSLKVDDQPKDSFS